MAPGGGGEELLLPTLDVDNVAVVWSRAVDEYLHNPILVPPTALERGRTTCEDCDCEEFAQPFGGGPFTTPGLNAMPWVVAGRQETFDFLGVRVKPGTEMALRGSVTNDGADAWTSGTVGCGKATLTGTFQCVGLNSRAVRFGYNWFQAMLRQCDDPCTASVLTVWLWCDQAASSGRRFLREARVIEFAISDATVNVPACQAIEVHVTWEIEDPRLWGAATTLRDTVGTPWSIDLASNNCTTCAPVSLCSPTDQGLVSVVMDAVRELRPIELRNDHTWCPNGSYPLSDLQLFGGRQIASPEVFTNADPVKISCDPCATLGIRLVWRSDEFPDGPHYEFQTVRWANNAWESQDIPIDCKCPVQIVELLHMHHVDEGSPPVPVLHRDLTGYSGTPPDGGECCLVELHWTSKTGGTWTSGIPEWNTAAQRTAWSPNLPDENQDEPRSGWPPIGCTMIIRRPACETRPGPRNLIACSDTDGPVRLFSDGSWEPVGWLHRITDTPWPPPARNMRVVDQVTDNYKISVLVESVDADCVPGGLAAVHAIPPLVDPLLGTVGTVDWCMSSAVCVYPITIPPFGAEKLGTVIVTVRAGATQIQWLRWAIWELIPGFGDFTTPASRANYKTIEPVVVGEMPIVGAGQQVIFDGQQDRILLNCSLGIIESEQAGFGPNGMFRNPVLPGDVGYVFAMLPHPWATPTDATYKVELVTWELP